MPSYQSYIASFYIVLNGCMEFSLAMTYPRDQQRPCAMSHTGQGALTPADTRDSSETRDNESEISGLSDMISNLHSLRREMDSDDISSTGTDTPTREHEASEGYAEGTPESAAAGSSEGHEGRTLETGELRRRTGN